jgi:pyruvate dehydrogenase E1 component alpha subunit
MSDPAKYRTREEVQAVRESSDPIELAKAKLLAAGWAREDDFKKLDKAVKAVVEEAVDFARESPEPPPEDLWTDVLVER